MKQKDALCVLLTGRSESNFGELVKRIVASRNLDFDMVSLKPAVGPGGERFDSTMHFKQVFLRRLMETYKGADEIRIYEDRPKHTKGFREFLHDYNKRAHGANAPRSPLAVAEVVQVADMSTNLDPVVEIAEIQHMINHHNEAVANKTKGFQGDRLMIKKTVFFTGYMINPADTKRLLTLASIPPGMSDAELKYHANNIMICPRPCPQSILEKVGGMGSKMKWAVTGTACHDKSIWAACLRPVPDTARFHTDNPSPLVVLALRKGAKPIDAAKIKNWQPIPPDKTFIFETTVGEKVLLRIEREDLNEDAYESLFPNKASKRKHAGDDSPPARYNNNDRSERGGGYHGPRGGGNHYNNHQNNNSNHRGGRGGFNNNYRGGGYRGGSKGGNHRGTARGGNRGGRGGRGGGGGGGGARHYHSLDDVGTRDFGGSSAMYDDSPGSGQWASSFNSTQSNNNNAGGGVDQYY